MVNLMDEKAKFRFKMKLDVRWSDLDQMQHVNNAVYHTYIEQARIYYFNELNLDWQKYNFILASTKMDFVKPIVFPADAYVYTRCTKFGTKSFEMQYMVTNMENHLEQMSAVATTTLVMFDYATQTSQPVPESFKQIICNFEPSLHNSL